MSQPHRYKIRPIILDVSAIGTITERHIESLSKEIPYVDAEGEWVRHIEYAAVAAENERLKEEIDCLQKKLRKANDEIWRLNY